MLTGPDLLSEAKVWIADHMRALGDDGFISTVNESPPDRDLIAMWWMLERGRYLAQVIVWEDGQAELDFADVRSDLMRAEHRQIDSRDELISALRAVYDWATGGPGEATSQL
ncbi:immunity protein TriTu family protein [Actinokineospora sp. NPDC004072]